MIPHDGHRMVSHQKIVSLNLYRVLLVLLSQTHVGSGHFSTLGMEKGELERLEM